MIKIYLCGSCSSDNRTVMIKAFNYLKKYFPDSEIYTPFTLKIENAWDLTQEKWSEEVFNKDIKELNNCDLFIHISFGRISSAGSNWEQGYAYALGKKIFVLQVTDNDTSLMTYCGCYNFYNAQNDLESSIKFISQNYNEKFLFKRKCQTILT